jgi:hypothetical protein
LATAFGEAMAAEKALQIARAARASTADGIVVGLKLAALFPPTPQILVLEGRRSEEQIVPPAPCPRGLWGARGDLRIGSP